jgi:hypothetical protein
LPTNAMPPSLAPPMGASLEAMAPPFQQPMRSPELGDRSFGPPSAPDGVAWTPGNRRPRRMPWFLASACVAAALGGVGGYFLVVHHAKSRTSEEPHTLMKLEALPATPDQTTPKTDKTPPPVATKAAAVPTAGPVETPVAPPTAVTAHDPQQASPTKATTAPPTPPPAVAAPDNPASASALPTKTTPGAVPAPPPPTVPPPTKPVAVAPPAAVAQPPRPRAPPKPASDATSECHGLDCL